MNKLSYILCMFCLTLSGCVMTDVWKDWEDEGVLSENRLRPSEVKKTLCAADGWKMSYEGVDFFFIFDENGNVVSDSDEKILTPLIETEYHLDFQGESIVLLNLSGGGMMQYLENNAEETFKITQCSDGRISATGQKFGQEMTLSAISQTEIETARKIKEEAAIKYNKLQSLENLKTQYSNGVLRNASGMFAAHYSIIYNEDNGWGLRVSSFDNGTLTHKDYSMTLDMENDERALLEIEGGAAIPNEMIGNIYYEYATGKIGVDTPGVTMDLTKSSDIINAYNAESWNTHIIDVNTICDALKGYDIQLEMDNRTPRHLVACPGTYNGNQFHYVFFEISPSYNDNTGRIYLKNKGKEEPFGGYGNDIENASAYLEGLLGFMFAEDGLWMYQDGEYLYAISPTKDLWFRMK